MSENYWICARCGHHNSLGERRCSVCRHKITKQEIRQAQEREARADDFDAVMNRRFDQTTFNQRSYPSKDTVGTRLSAIRNDMAINRRQPFYLKAVQLVIDLLLVLAVMAFAYGLFQFVKNGYFDGLGDVGGRLADSVVNIFKNTYNYFLNLNFSNNALVRVGSIIANNLINLFSTIGDNIVRLISLF